MSSGRKKGNGHKIKYWKFHAKIRKKLFFNYDGDQTLEQAAWRGYGFLIFSNTQNKLDIVLSNPL